MAKKEKKVIEDSKKKNQADAAAKLMGLSTGIISAYLLGYIGSINVSVIEGLKIVLDNIKHGKIFYLPGYKTFIGWIIGVLIGLFIWFRSKNDSERHFTTDMETSAGSGGFMDEETFNDYKAKYISKDPEPILDVSKIEVEDDYEKEKEKYSKNMIMTNEFCRPINSRELIGNSNVLVVGGAGSGKSRFFIKPNILQMNASYVITDPSGEMINSVGKTLVDHGYKIKVFNISDMAHSNTYNPFAYIRDEAGVNMVISCLIDNTTKGEVGGDNQFFVDAEKLLYSACIFYLKDFCDDINRKNFAGVMTLINASSVNENNADAKSDLDELFDKLPKSSLAWKFYKSFKQAAGKTLKSIIISCTTRLQPFLTPQVINLTRTDNLELGKIGDEKTALFIITPQADRTYAFLASMLYTQLFETLYYKGEQQLANGGSEQMKIPVRCLMDEFANIGTVPNFPSKLSTMRKYNISAAVVLQDISQIETMYKGTEWQTLVGNCSSILFLGSPEPNTQKYFSEMLGKKTIRTKSTGESKGKSGSFSSNFQYTSREVMTPDELGRLPSDECILITQNLRPYKGKKYKYENHPYYKTTSDYNSDNAFEYKKYSVFDNSKNNYRGLIAAQSAVAKQRERQNRIKSMNSLKKEMGDPNLVANEINLSKKQEKRLLSSLMIEAERKIVDKYKDEIAVIKIDAEMPSKYLFALASATYQSTQKKSFIIFGGVKNEKDVIPGVGYAVPERLEDLRKAMENDFAIADPRTIETSDKFKNCLLTTISAKNFESYVKHINKYCNENIKSE